MHKEAKEKEEDDDDDESMNSFGRYWSLWATVSWSSWLRSWNTRPILGSQKSWSKGQGKPKKKNERKDIRNESIIQVWQNKRFLRFTAPFRSWKVKRKSKRDKNRGGKWK